jgi:alanyl-tRNA synthetase
VQIIFQSQGTVEDVYPEVDDIAFSLAWKENLLWMQAHHTATHLLQAALKDVLGSDVSQAGSLVAFDRLRFDFNLPRAMTEAEVTKVETLVNEWIGMGVSVSSEEMAIAVAKEKGAIAMFGEKYGEQVCTYILLRPLNSRFFSSHF